MSDSTSWWDGLRTDWATGDAGRFVDVLAFAYGTREELARIVDEVRKAVPVEFDQAEMPPIASADELWRWVLTAAPSNVLDLAAVVLHDDASSHFHVPLRHLLGGRLGEVNARIVSRYGLPPPPTDGPDTLVKTIVEVDPQTIDPRREGLQAVTAVGAGFTEPRAAIQARQDLMARTAMIEIAGQPRGTGFLVGECLLLTAAHVLDRDNWPPRSLRTDQVEVVFDYWYSGRSASETGIRVRAAEFLAGSLPTRAEVHGTAGADWDAPADRLDFALIRLATPPPERSPAAQVGTGSRGHYQLHTSAYEFRPETIYIIMEHPLGGFLTLTEFAGTVVSQRQTRMRYGGNTLAGASGSAIVDNRGRLVGLHHSHGGGVNQGVPISVIAQRLHSGPEAKLLQDGTAIAAAREPAPVDPFGTTSVLRRRPFVNRQVLRNAIRDMAERNGARVLSINGDRGAGVSHSYLLASHIAEQSMLCAALREAAPDGLRAVRIDLRQYYRAYAVEQVRANIVAHLLMELGIVVRPTDQLAQDARDTITVLAAISAKLRGSDQQWWLFFDSIDSLLTVKQGEVDELICALINLAEDAQVPLRIVLAGHAAEQFTEEYTVWAEHDNATGLNRGDVQGWLERRAAEEGREIDTIKLNSKLTALFPTGSLPEPRMLALRLPTALLEVLKP